MSAIADRTVAQVVAAGVHKLFAHKRGGMSRLRGFTRGEVLAIVEALSPWANDDVTLIVVSDSEIPGLDSRHCLPPDKSATWYRNNTKACVFIEAGDYSDRQSLRNVKTLSDGDILDATNLRESAGEVLAAAWAGVQPRSTVPELMRVLCGSVAAALEGAGIKPSVRRFVKFCLSWAGAAASQGAVDSEVARRTLGAALPHLGLFEDSLLGASQGDVVLTRRLSENALTATGKLRGERELDRDELAEQVGKTDFIDIDGRPLNPKRLAELRARLTDYLQAHGQPDTSGIEFHAWEQLLSHKSARKGVGTQVAEEIAAHAPARRAELDQLDVIAGLDGRSSDAARRLLDAAGSEDEPALVDLLGLKLRHQVDRIATQSFPAVACPLRQLIHLLGDARDEELTDGFKSNTGETLRVEFRQREPGEAVLAASLFAFLYGPTLRTVVQGASGGWSLAVDAELLDTEPLRKWILAGPSEDESSEENDEDDERGGDEGRSDLGWKDLELRLRRTSDQAILGRFRWGRSQFLGHLVTVCAFFSPDEGAWQTNEESFDTWVERVVETRRLGGSLSVRGELHPLMAQLAAVRARGLSELAQLGLDAQALATYVREWSGLLTQFAETFVPTDASFEEVEEFMRLDTVRFGDEAVALLATHPLRLRWLVRHLECLRESIDGLLRGTWQLNRVNPNFYLNHLQNASPHSQPPVLCDRSRVHVAVREDAWHEHFVVAQDRKTSYGEWLADLDDASIDEMALVVGRYVDAHPHKHDGLSLLLLVRRGGTRFCERILQQIFTQRTSLGRFDRTKLTLHVIADRAEFGRVGEIIEAFDDPEHHVASDFPRMRVVFYAWDEDDPLRGTQDLDGEIDLAIVPNLFTTHTRFLASHREAGDRVGQFDPWIDSPTSRSSKAGRNAVRDLLPKGQDEALDTWSTLAVRHFRARKVSEDDGIDYFSLQVEVTQSEDFFTRLHAIAHWVVTLDAYVGRHHIEALAAPPEIITTKPGLGKARAHTMIVSSQVGRKFIVRRLARRLQNQLGSSLGVEPTRIAELLYDRARELAPGTVLRAVGLGRTAQELVGLVVSKTLVAQMTPARLGSDGFEAWISLDAHQDWFGGTQGSRADLLRLVGVLEQHSLTLRATVVEAKLRENSSVRRAEVQVSNTCSLLADALRPSEQQPPADAKVWRRAIVSAIDEVVRGDQARGARGSFRAFADGRPTDELGGQIREWLLDGSYELVLDGVVCTMTLDGAGGDTITSTDGYRWIRASIAEVRALLEHLDDDEFEAAGPLPAIVSKAPEPNMVSEPCTADPSAAEPSAAEPSAGPRPNAGGERGSTASVVRGQSSEQLLVRYQKILSAFAEYGIEVRRDEDEPVLEGPGFYVFRVRPGHGVRPAKLSGFAEDLQYKLELPAGRMPRSYIDRGAVVFEVPKHESERYYISANELWSGVDWPRDRLWVSIGEDVRGNEVSIDFSSNDTPHLLIGGITGSGKSVALETILIGLTRHYGPEQLQLSLVDPKGTELEFLRGDAHVSGEIGIYPQDALELLQSMVDEMDRRFALLKVRRVHKLSEYNKHPDVGVADRLPWRLIVLDEYADLTSDRDDRVAIEHPLQRLTQKARAAGIHVIVATQRPSAEIISTTVRSNLGAQLALRVKTAVDSRIIMDETGAEALAGNGDAFLKGSGGDKIRLQCAKA